MILFQRTIIILIFLIVTFACSNNADDTSESEKCVQHPVQTDITYINTDSIPTTIIGENGIDDFWKVPLGEPVVKQIQASVIIPGISTIKEVDSNSKETGGYMKTEPPVKTFIDRDMLVSYKPDNSESVTVEYVKILNVRDSELGSEGYSVQNGDTVYKPSGYNIVPEIIKSSGFNAVETLYDVRTLNTTEDIDRTKCVDILHDSKGNLWLATMPGLFMFDGSNYYLISKEYVSSVFEDSKGNIWFSTHGSGVFYYNGETIVNFCNSNGLGSAMVYSITEDNSGNIWFTSGSQMISKYDGNSFTNFKFTETNTSYADYSPVLSSYSDSKGNIWFGFFNGQIKYFNGTEFIDFYHLDGETNLNVNDICEDKYGNMWFATGKGLLCYEGDTMVFYGNRQGVPEFVTDICEVDDDMWFCTMSGDLLKYNRSSFTRVNVIGSSDKKPFTSIEKDDAGSIWLGSSSPAVYKLKQGSFNTYTTKEGLPFNVVNAVREDSEGNLWFGTANGLSFFDGNIFKNYSPLSNLGPYFVMDVFEDSKHRIWVAVNSRGIGYIENGYLYIILDSHGLNINNVYGIDEDSKGNIWVASANGLNSINGNVVKSYFKAKEGSFAPIYSVYVDNADRIWFGGMGDLKCMVGNKVITYTDVHANGDKGRIVNSIEEDSQGRIWASTLNGISCFTEGEVVSFNHKNGLQHGEVASIKEDSVGNFWISTLRGLSYMTFDTVDTFTGDEPQYLDGKRAYFYNFSDNDGVYNHAFNYMSSDKDRSNRIWWGGDKCLTMLDGNVFQLPDNTPEVKLTGVIINGQRVHEKHDDESNKLKVEYSSLAHIFKYPVDMELKYGLYNFTFSYSVTELDYPDHIKYQYALEGLDDDWRDFTSENSVEYQNITPGDYIFKVRAIGASKKWSSTLEYPFVINPPWWYSWWAYLLYVVFGVAFVFLTIRLRTKGLIRYSEMLEEKVKERTNLIEAQKEELMQQNEEILAVNNSLNEQKEIVEERNRELDDQKEELRQQNEEISSINNSLNEQKKIIEERNDELSAQNEEIVTQRDLLAKQHSDITDSIEYAKRIQQAVMPNEYYIDELIPENFIFFKPKDVVSGDFYWVKQVNNKIVMVAADCTGHGVPGAIMSMLGISFLNDIVHKREITKADLILNELRKEVKRALKQSSKNTDSRDGMDIALCVLDPKTNKLEYAGAYNPLYLIRNGELIEYKADKMPIGVFMNDINPFTSHEIDLQIGDTFYMFSDGFQDQIGGEFDKKYMVRNYKKFLVDIHKKPMEMQRQMLNDEHTKWMGDYDQIDDILVFGVRIL